MTVGRPQTVDSHALRRSHLAGTGREPGRGQAGDFERRTESAIYPLAVDTSGVARGNRHIEWRDVHSAGSDRRRGSSSRRTVHGQKGRRRSARRVRCILLFLRREVRLKTRTLLRCKAAGLVLRIPCDQSVTRILTLRYKLWIPRPRMGISKIESLCIIGGIAIRTWSSCSTIPLPAHDKQG